MHSKVLSLLLLLSAVSGCLTAKIVMTPMFARSHYIVMEKLGQELKARGHQVTILMGSEATYAAGKSNVKTFKVSEAFKKERFQHVKNMSRGHGSLFESLSNLFSRQQQVHCDLFLSSKNMMSELKTADILIGDCLYFCSSLVADLFNIPHVAISMSSIRTPSMLVFGLSSYPSYVPQFFSFLPRDMRFLDRIFNLWFYLTNLYLVERYVYPVYGELKTKYKIKPEKSIRETLAKADMILLTLSTILDHAQPILPNVREVGNFLPSPAKPLPADQSSGDNGVIFVSFGSMVDTLSDNVIDVMNEAFSKMPQRILWRLNLGAYKGTIALNIKIVQWVPQNDVLGHNKTRLFFTHAGANGIAEAAFHGVPMLCSPFFGDQHDNSRFLKDSGFGEIVIINTVTMEQLTNLLKQMTQEKRYRDRIHHVSKVLKSSPRSPVEEAAELIEYVHAVGDLSHLKPRGLGLSFYQLYMLDVLLVVGIVFSVLLCIFVTLVRLVVKNCCGSFKKGKNIITQVSQGLV